ncbi:MAG: hypothetical protein HC777_03440, partial [Hyphomonadaceae bacterium]|nr:hypothetical protein [Hyphomonadaceae bacterium]
MRSVLIGLFITSLATPALADAASPWSFGATVGYDIPVSGDVLATSNSTPLNLNSFNTNLTGTGILRLRGTDYQDSYDNAVRATIEVRYAMSDLSEFFGAFTYTNAEGKTANAGCLETAGVCTTGLNATLSDYRQYGLEVGYRQWFNMAMLGDNVRPYFSVRGGVVRTDAINALLATPTDGIANWRLYKETYAYTIGADVGASVTLSPNAELGGEVGIRYQTALRENDLDFGAFGLGNVNDKSER